MKRLLFLLGFLLVPSCSWAQCNGVFPANTVCGNLTGTAAPPSPQALSATGVLSVTASDSTLNISPTTGLVLESLALNHPNTWTATQAFPAGSLTAAELAAGAASTNIGALGGALSGTLPNPTIAAGTVTNSMFANMPADTVKCNNTGSPATPADCTNIVIAGITVNPTASSINLAYQSTQSASGTPGGSNYSGASGTGYALNNLTISSDNMAINTSTIAIGYGWAINHQFGGSSMTGARSALGINATLTTSDSASNTLPLYVGSTTYVTTTVNDGGTNTGGGARGALFAENPFVCLCGAGATNYSIAAGGEVNMSIRGGSVANKLGWYVLLDAADTVNGANNDFAFGFMSNGSAPFKQGFVASDTFTGKSPIAASGTFIGENFSGGPYTITNGVDLSGWFFTGNAFRSPSFQVDGSGNLNAISFSQGANAGIDCLAGVTAATVVVHKGIVTHC